MIPIRVQVIGQTTSSVELAWSPISGTTVYKVLELRAANSAIRTYWGSLPHCQITGLDSNHCYTFQVHAMRGTTADDDDDVGTATFTVHTSSALVRTNTLPPPPNALSLNRAVRNSQEYLLKRFLAIRPDLLAVPGPQGLLPLCTAVQGGNRDLVDIMLRFGADVNAASPGSQRTALQLALFGGHVAIAKSLVERKADLLRRDCVDQVAIDYALDGGVEAAVRYALELYADVLRADGAERTLDGLLRRAVVMRSSESVVGVLLNYARGENLRIDAGAGMKLALCSDQHAIADLIGRFSSSAESDTATL